MLRTRAIGPRRPLRADIVAKVFLGGRTKFFRAADAFYERRRERPYRFIQNRPRISVVALKSNTAAEKSKDQLSQQYQPEADFPTKFIFDYGRPALDLESFLSGKTDKSISIRHSHRGQRM